MANTDNEWEVSKENICPIQQGRKPSVLRSALSLHPQDKMLSQRRAFETELRTYDGDDPLKNWCNYIKWAEQNYPKGGNEGDISVIIQQCLSILRDEEKYKDDDRFIDIWLKFANFSRKPLEVYSNMFSHNIGCKNAKFYMNWSWEQEQLGNIKKADEILTEGLRRKAEPVESLKAAHNRLEQRLIKVFATESETFQENNYNEFEHRSAFTVLKSQKKNKAPILRVGDAVIQTKHQDMIVNSKKNHTVNAPKAKPSFKIFSDEHQQPSSLPPNNQNTNSIFCTADSKENDKKVSKWSRVKVHQQAQCSTEQGKTPKIDFHYDESPQPSSASKVTKDQRVLSSRKCPASPPIVVFEPFDETKRSMYDKTKVYGGAEEFSFEEIRAAKWQKQQKKLQEEQEKENMKKELQLLRDKVAKLENLESQFGKFLPVQENREVNSKLSNNVKMVQRDKCIYAESSVDSHINSAQVKSLNQPYLHDITENEIKNSSKNRNETSVNILADHVSDSNDGIYNLDALKHSTAPTMDTANVVADMVQELYNGTLSSSSSDRLQLSHILNNTDERDNSVNSKIFHFSTSQNLSIQNKEKILPHQSDSEQNKISNSSANNDVISQSANNIQPGKSPLFTFYHDPTDIICPKPKNLPYAIFQDNNEMKDNTPYFGKDNKLQIENEENIPPPGYVQEHSDKRELAGILQPSKNVYYLPLEQQKLDDEGEDSDSEGFIAPLPVDDNFTMVLPLNGEQFDNAPKFSSTPCIKATPISGKRENACPTLGVTQEEEDYVLSTLPGCLHTGIRLTCSLKVREILQQVFSEVNDKSEQILCNEGQPKDLLQKLQFCLDVDTNPKFQSIIKHCIKLIENSIPKIKESNQTNHFVQKSLHLSTIMETSREGSSKSSSSSCSSISVLRGKSLHQSHGLTNSVQKSLAKIVSNDAIGNASGNFCGTTVETHLQNADATKASANLSILTNSSIDIDPFDPTLTSALLQCIQKPICERENFFECKNLAGNIKVGMNLKLGNVACLVDRLYAEGAYAKIYTAQCLTNEIINFDSSITPAQRMAVKVCKNTNEWEFYVCSELSDRLQSKNRLPDITNSVLQIKTAVSYRNSIVLLSDLYEHGTLLGIVNTYKHNGSTIPQPLILYFALEMLQILSEMHNCGIIHGDIKPDNFIINDLPSFDQFIMNLQKKTSILRLIDFGRSIDLTLLKPGITFKTVITTDSFQCNEMKDGRPWVFQSDWYGMLACIYILLFGEYMKVKKNTNGAWEPTYRFRRYWQNDIWIPLFDTFLNIPSSYEVPDVKPFISAITEKLTESPNSLKVAMLQLYSYISK